MNNLTLAPLVALGTLVFTLINFLKFLRTRDWGAALTQICAWAAGVAAVLLFTQTQFSSGITVNGHTPFNTLDFWSQVFIGLLAASILSTVNEIKKAIDTTDSAVTPHLFTFTGPTINRTRRWRLRSPFGPAERVTVESSGIPEHLPPQAR